MKKEKIKTVNSPIFSKSKLKSAIEVSEFAESIINTVREPLLALDQDLRVVKASRSFYEFFQVSHDETIGTLIYNLGNNQWDIPKLRELLETILPEKTTFDNYEVEHDFATIGKRIMLLNARQIERAFGKEKVILLAIEDITERKQIEDGLDKTRKELAVIKISADEVSEFAENLIDTVREPLLVLDQDLRIVKANRSFYDFFKVAPDETIGTLIYDLGNQQWNIPKLRELLERILPKKSPFENYEVEHDFATIGKRIMLLNARQIERASGKEKVILLAIEDITEHKLLENLLAESEERFRRLFETADDGILLLEKSGFIIRYANPSITKIFGYSIEECIGRKLNDIGFPDDIETSQEILQTLDNNGIFYYKDALIHKKTGQFTDTDIYMVDKANLVQCNIRDITERKQAEDKLRKSEEKFRAVAETLPIAIYLSVGMEQKCEYLNPMFTKLFGYTREEVPTVEQWWPLAYPEETYRNEISGEWNQRVKCALETKSTIKPMETVVACKDGSKKYIVWNYITIGENNYACGLDLTERMQAEKQIQRDLKEKTLLLQEIHHRTKNNLQMISSLMQMQESTIRTKEDALKGFKVTQDRIRTMAKAYEILLRSEYMSEIKLSDYITELADQLSRNYDIHGKVHIDYTMDDVLFDAEKLSKLGLILNEIITNSIKYAFEERDEGNIHITLKDEKDHITIKISDDGIGIPENINIPNTTTLGLSLVDMLMGEFHGTYSIDRKNGTSFTLNIPKE